MALRRCHLVLDVSLVHFVPVGVHAADRLAPFCDTMAVVVLVLGLVLPSPTKEVWNRMEKEKGREFRVGMNRASGISSPSRSLFHARCNTEKLHPMIWDVRFVQLDVRIVLAAPPV